MLGGWELIYGVEHHWNLGDDFLLNNCNELGGHVHYSMIELPEWKTHHTNSGNRPMLKHSLLMDAKSHVDSPVSATGQISKCQAQYETAAALFRIYRRINPV